jgi:hypothetical protein
MAAQEVVAAQADLFLADDPFARLELDDAIDQQERRPMRDDRLDLVGIHYRPHG